jgi:beta-1,4-mannosyl-glycoprotein beta-1,4-N-acetylglucosaminyltransferase
MAGLVYDCFTFFNELDLLEIRLNVLFEAVDKFVLVEADRTFTNKEKPFYFDENKEKYKQFSNKIIHIKIVDYPETKNAWDMEHYQRNQIVRGLIGCSLDDTVLIADIDEIPNPEIIMDYKRNGKDVCALEQIFFYYYLNYQKCIDKYWYFAKIARYYEIFSNNNTPQKIRMENDTKTIKNGGWHFSYLGGVEAIKYKIQSFAHQEYNNENYINNKIENKLKLGFDIFDRKDYRFIPVKITRKSHPQYIIDNKHKYAHLIYPYINQCIVMKNTLYCLGLSLFALPKKIIIGIVKMIVPQGIVNKIKNMPLKPCPRRNARH